MLLEYQGFSAQRPCAQKGNKATAQRSDHNATDVSALVAVVFKTEANRKLDRTGQV